MISYYLLPQVFVSPHSGGHFHCTVCSPLLSALLYIYLHECAICFYFLFICFHLFISFCFLLDPLCVTFVNPSCITLCTFSRKLLPEVTRAGFLWHGGVGCPWPRLAGTRRASGPDLLTIKFLFSAPAAQVYKAANTSCFACGLLSWLFPSFGRLEMRISSAPT